MKQSKEPAVAADRPVQWTFGDCALDGASLQLTVGGQWVNLEPKPLNLLLYLIRHAGEVVTKDELLEAVWPGRITSESVLTKAVARLRLALRDEAQELIRTVHGFGYRLVAPVTAHVSRDAVAPTIVEGLVAGAAPPGRPLWVLKQRLGGGGNGETWLVEHAKTHERRAFKFADDPERLVGLKREIALFRLLREVHGERPDFVRMLDWNLDESPYFIESEYLSDGSLTQWAERHPLGTQTEAVRIEIAARIAEALGAAHAAGVLHKDLKPANILIKAGEPGQAPTIKLGDFGSGRLLDLARIEHLEITRLGLTQTVMGKDSSSGTPFYFAPELMAGQQATVQSDIYALGVILYQLVVGDLTRPLAPGWEEDVADPLLREDIAAAAASRPANRLQSAADLAARLRSLEPRRARQQQQAQALAEAQSLREKLERAALRRTWLRSLVAILLLGLGLSLWQYRAAVNASEAAQRSARQAEAVARFLTDDVFGRPDPMDRLRSRLTIESMLDEAVDGLDQRFADEPGVRARIGLGLAHAYVGIGDEEAEIRLLQRSLTDAEQAQDPAGDLALRIILELGQAYALRGEFEQSAAAYQRVLDQQPVLGATHPRVLDALEGRAYFEYRRGNFAESARQYEAYRALLTEEEHGDRIGSVDWNLPEVYLELGRFADAEALIRRAIARETRAGRADGSHEQWLRVTLGDTLMMQEKWDEAEAAFTLAESRLGALLGPKHPYTLTALHYRGQLNLRRGRPEPALPILERAYAGRLEVQGAEHSWTRYSANRLGQALTRVGRPQEAVELLRSTLDVAESIQGAQHPDALDIRCSLAEALIASERSVDAASLLRDALPQAEARLPPGSERLVQLRELLQKATRASASG